MIGSHGALRQRPVTRRANAWLWKTAGWLLVAGILLFSDNLYALALSGARCSAR
jgi:uncharacterized membrane protein YgdD (TMEM256/DUF423 family)